MHCAVFGFIDFHLPDIFTKLNKLYQVSSAPNITGRIIKIISHDALRFKPSFVIAVIPMEKGIPQSKTGIKCEILKKTNFIAEW